MSQSPYSSPPPYGSVPPSQGSTHFLQHQPPQRTATEPGLDRPWYGVGFLPAWGRAFRKYLVVTGRASRGEFWWLVLGNALVALVGSILVSTVGVDWSAVSQAVREGLRPPLNAFGSAVTILVWLYALASLLPTLSAGIRRLHDTDRSGWWWLVVLIPLVGEIWFIVLAATDTYPGPTRWDPLEAGARPTYSTGR